MRRKREREKKERRWKRKVEEELCRKKESNTIGHARLEKKRGSETDRVFLARFARGNIFLFKRMGREEPRQRKMTD